MTSTTLSCRAQRTQALGFWLLACVVFGLGWGCTPPAEVKKTPTRQAPVETKKTAEDNYQDALSLYKQGKSSGNVEYKQVIGLYRKALEEKPSLVQARFNLAAIYEEMGEHSQAANTLADLLRQNSEHAPSIYRLAQVYFRMKQYRSALSLMRRYLKLKPEHQEKPSMLLNMAAIMVEAGDYTNALGLARKVLALDKENVAAYRLIARVYLKQRRYAGVHLVYQLAQKLKKPDARLENIRGLAFLGQRKYPQAILAFSSATQIDPTLFAAQMNLGSLALQYQDTQRAARALGAAVKLRPRHRQAWLAYAVALRANKRFKHAEEVYQKRLLSIKRNDPDALFNLGVLYVKFMNRPEDGKTYLRRFIGERGDQISNNHQAHQLLKQAEQAILMKQRMQQQMKQDQQRAKSKAPARRAPAPRAGAPQARN